MMQRRHYELIAQVLRTAKPADDNPPCTWEELCEAFADACKRDNPQFKYERFYNACGMDD